MADLSSNLHNGIDNFGTLQGDVLLGTNTLNLLSSNLSENNQPLVHGNITGISGSSIIIGNLATPTHFIHANTLTAEVSNITVSKNSSLTLNEGARWTATAQSPDAIRINGDYISDGNTFLVGNTTNTANIKIKEKLAPSTLSITGNYVGQNGVLSLNTTLDDDNSPTDKFIISGNASGSTQVQVNNLKGAGAQTVNGIRIIETGSSTSNAFFIANNGYVTAGVYDYGLSQIDNDWYLKSHKNDGETDIPIYTP